MIKETNDLELINSFLTYFDTKIDINPFRKYLVYEDKAILVYSLIYDRLEIDYIYVKEEYRGNGIASILLEYLFKKHGYSCSLEVRVDNKEAINLYKKFNFEIVTIRKNYYKNVDAYLMIRK